MKSRLMVSLLVIAMAAAMIGGATMAWFTDDDAADPVSFAAGTLLIDMTELEYSGINFDEARLENLNPGDSWSYDFTVTNVGTKNFNYLLYLCWQDIIGQENTELGEDMQAILADKDYGTNELSEVLEWEITRVGASEDFVWDGKLPEEGPFSVDAPALAPGKSAKYVVRVTLPTDADNAYQGSAMNLAFGVKAWQTTNDAPPAEVTADDCPFGVEQAH